MVTAEAEIQAAPADSNSSPIKDMEKLECNHDKKKSSSMIDLRFYDQKGSCDIGCRDFWIKPSKFN